MFISLHKLTRLGVRVASGGALLLVVACGAQTRPVRGIHDPYEAENRAVHQTNVELDRALVKPVSGGYGRIMPAPVRKGVSNFAANINLPGVVVNDLLQLNIDHALKNSVRFLFNTTIGLGGILDPSTAMGLNEEPTDFGATLYVWGVGEGPYIELPILGPATQRDMVGKVVDLFTNPLTYGVLSAEKYVGTVAHIGAKLGERYRYSNTIDSILYDSADSYAQARLLYLQNRRFNLSGGKIDESTSIFDALYGK